MRSTTPDVATTDAIRVRSRSGMRSFKPAIPSGSRCGLASGAIALVQNDGTLAPCLLRYAIEQDWLIAEGSPPFEAYHGCDRRLGIRTYRAKMTLKRKLERQAQQPSESIQTTCKLLDSRPLTDTRRKRLRREVDLRTAARKSILNHLWVSPRAGVAERNVNWSNHRSTRTCQSWHCVPGIESSPGRRDGACPMPLRAGTDTRRVPALPSEPAPDRGAP
jgi:hypothetical protein